MCVQVPAALSGGLSLQLLQSTASLTKQLAGSKLAVAQARPSIRQDWKAAQRT